MKYILAIMLAFETFTELHYSQTISLSFPSAILFETFTELHYSQTFCFLLDVSHWFETFTELHYSQTCDSPQYSGVMV